MLLSKVYHEEPEPIIVITNNPANRLTLSLLGRVIVLNEIEFNSSRHNKSINYWFLETKEYTNILKLMNTLVRAALYQTEKVASNPAR